MRDAERSRTPLVPTGHGAHAYLGNPPPLGSKILSLARLRRVLRYEPGDFTVGVEAGLPLEELAQVLDANGQEIPADPGSAGTAGGLVAAAQPGFRRGSLGPLRSWVIGMNAVRGGASTYKTGGMVVKNVAGYEVMKLLVGSFGTAGPILEVNFKLRPLPERRLGGMASFATRDDAWRAASALRDLRIDLAALWLLSGSAPEDFARGAGESAGAACSVVWLLEGSSQRVAWQEAQIDAALRGGSVLGTRALTGAGVDHLLSYFSAFASPGAAPTDDLGIARLCALPADAPTLEGRALAAFGPHDAFEAAAATDVLCGIVTARWRRHAPGSSDLGAEARGTVPSGHGLAGPLADLRKAAEAARGAATLVYLPPDLRREHRHAISGVPNPELIQRLLTVLDPAGIFSPGRILGNEPLRAPLANAHPPAAGST